MAQAPSFSGDLAGRLLSAAPRWALGLLVVLIGIRAALLVAGIANPPVAAAPAGPLPQVSSRNLVDLPSILRANLFGQSVVTGTDAPNTTMNLKLVLVFAESDEKLGLAALGPTPTDIKVYKVGDQVPGGARLHAVYVDSVLLDRKWQHRIAEDAATRELRGCNGPTCGWRCTHRIGGTRAADHARPAGPARPR